MDQSATSRWARTWCSPSPRPTAAVTGHPQRRGPPRLRRRPGAGLKFVSLGRRRHLRPRDRHVERPLDRRGADRHPDDPRHRHRGQSHQHRRPEHPRPARRRRDQQLGLRLRGLHGARRPRDPEGRRPGGRPARRHGRLHDHGHQQRPQRHRRHPVNDPPSSRRTSPRTPPTTGPSTQAPARGPSAAGGWGDRHGGGLSAHRPTASGNYRNLAAIKESRSTTPTRTTTPQPPTIRPGRGHRRRQGRRRPAGRDHESVIFSVGVRNLGPDAGRRHGQRPTASGSPTSHPRLWGTTTPPRESGPSATSTRRPAGRRSPGRPLQSGRVWPRPVQSPTPRTPTGPRFPLRPRPDQQRRLRDPQPRRGSGPSPHETARPAIFAAPGGGSPTGSGSPTSAASPSAPSPSWRAPSPVPATFLRRPARGGRESGARGKLTCATIYVVPAGDLRPASCATPRAPRGPTGPAAQRCARLTVRWSRSWHRPNPAACVPAHGPRASAPGAIRDRVRLTGSRGDVGPRDRSPLPAVDLACG